MHCGSRTNREDPLLSSHDGYQSMIGQLYRLQDLNRVPFQAAFSSPVLILNTEILKRAAISERAPARRHPSIAGFRNCSARSKSGTKPRTIVRHSDLGLGRLPLQSRSTLAGRAVLVGVVPFPLEDLHARADV